MKNNFDVVIDRRHNKYSYSTKWCDAPFISGFLNADINDDTIALYTADMDFKSPQPIIDAMHGVAEHGIYGYSLNYKSDYNDAIISWFKRRMNWTILPEEITYIDGTVKALREIILAFTNPGDGVIIQRPIYGPFTSVINMTGRTLVNNQMISEDGYYTIDFKDLEEKAKDPNNKLILLCNPHNPVGRIWREDELKEISRICLENDVLIATDEIHGDLIRKEETFIPMATLVDNSNLITCTAVNKTFNLAGLHCTNVVIKNKELRDKFNAQAGMNMPTPFAIAALVAAYSEEGSEIWLEELKEYLDGNIDFAINFLKENMPKVKVRRPEGTYVLWMDFRDYGISADEIHDRIYRKANVLLEWGAMFDPDNGDGFERICLPSPRSIIKEAFERIAKAFEDLN